MTVDGSQPALLMRFSGARGRDRVLDALKEQRIINGDSEAAEKFCAVGKLAYFATGQSLTTEGSWENDLVFLLAGKTAVEITGLKIGERVAGHHIGEMALIDPSQPRSATVTAIEPTVGLVVSEEDFSRISSDHPNIWRQISKRISDRLRQRRKFIRPSNPAPLLFIACASESLNVANAMRGYFEEQTEIIVEVWTDGVFKPSQGTMESLEGKLEVSDFAVAIFSADDKVISRGEEKVAPRDNTVFELGLFGGAIGRSRSFFAVQAGVDLKIPSDLAGITSLRFFLAEDENGIPDVAEACAQVHERIQALGPR